MKTFISSLLAIVCLVALYFVIHSFTFIKDQGAITAILTLCVLVGIIFFAAWNTNKVRMRR